jgi:hypothetical protein
VPGVGWVRRGLLGGRVVRGNGVHAQYADFAWHTNDPKYSKHTEYADYPEQPDYAAQHAHRAKQPEHASQ